jgi:hypothetical protein
LIRVSTAPAAEKSSEQVARWRGIVLFLVVLHDLGVDDGAVAGLGFGGA